ncbi:MAG: hypothetical protein K2X41_10905 [Hyphomicrobium sp.]|nr:hypothetical protein [Hyphomicrobium sp.]
MSKTISVSLMACALGAALAGVALADADDKAAKTAKMKFWNLTGVDLTEVFMAPAGTEKFGDNQTKNDDDNHAEADERLPLTDITSGMYDVRIKDKDGRSCLVKNVEVKDTGPYSFSLEADQLTDCKT